MSDTKDHHRVPRISASKMERILECPSSFAREWEIHGFLQKHGLPKMASGAMADRGTAIHDFLSKIDFASSLLDMGGDRRDWSAYRKVKEASERHQFQANESEFWFCVNAIAKRDRLIEFAVQEAGDVQNLEVLLDCKRLQWDVNDGEGTKASLTGLGDVVAKVERADGGVTLVVCDYKTLYGEHMESATNPQLATLAVLSKQNDPRIDKAYVAMITNLQRNDEIDAAYYTGEMLESAALRMKESALLAEKLAGVVRDSLGPAGELSASLNEKLDAHTATGNHCLYCPGKVCCSKLQLEADQFLGELTADAEWANATKKLCKEQKDAAMTAEEMTQVLGRTTALAAKYKVYDQLDSEVKDLARKLMSAGNPVEGFELVPGKTRPVIRSRVASEDMLDDAQETELDVSPAAVFERLKPLLAKVTGGNASMDEFLQACCSVSATQLRAFLSTKSGVDEKRVYDELLAPLGNDNPVELKRDAPSVMPVKVKVQEDNAQENKPKRRRVAA